MTGVVVVAVVMAAAVLPLLLAVMMVVVAIKTETMVTTATVRTATATTTQLQRQRLRWMPREPTTFQFRSLWLCSLAATLCRTAKKTTSRCCSCVRSCSFWTRTTRGGGSAVWVRCGSTS